MADPMRGVRGRCPACGSEALFLGSGGHLTCSIAECPDPGAVTHLLCRPAYHVLQVGAAEDGWALQHEVTCMPDLLDCELHYRVKRCMDALTGPPVPPGRYRVNPETLSLTRLGNEATDG